MTTGGEKPKRRFWRRLRVLLPFGFVLLYAVFYTSPLWLSFVLGPPPIEVSRETTYFTEPLLPDGTVDYDTAVNRTLSEGITPEQNIAVAWFALLGLERDYERIGPEKMARWLKFDVTRGDGPKFVGLHQYTEQQGLEPVDDKVEDHVCDWPWRSEAYPVIAAWLAANESALDAALAACDRERYFMPRETWMITTALRWSAGMLATRAMGLVGSGDYDAARRHARGLMRLGRLMSNQRELGAYLVGLAIDSRGRRVLKRMLVRDDLPTNVVDAIERDLDALPPRRPLADAIDLGDRLMTLELMLHDSENFKLRELHDKRLIDLNYVLREHNKATDQLVGALRLPTYAQRRAALGAIEAEWEKRSEKSSDWKYFILRYFFNQRKTVSDVMVGLLNALGGAGRRCDMEEAHRLEVQLLRVAIALQRYRGQHGRWPAALDELTPVHIKEVPIDTFSGQPLRYERRGGHYVLWSVGRDGVDDHAERNKYGRYTDLVIRTDDKPVEGSPPRGE